MLVFHQMDLKYRAVVGVLIAVLHVWLEEKIFFFFFQEKEDREGMGKRKEEETLQESVFW